MLHGMVNNELKIDKHYILQSSAIFKVLKTLIKLMCSTDVSHVANVN